MRSAEAIDSRHRHREALDGDIGVKWLQDIFGDQRLVDASILVFMELGQHALPYVHHLCFLWHGGRFRSPLKLQTRQEVGQSQSQCDVATDMNIGGCARTRTMLCRKLERSTATSFLSFRRGSTGGMCLQACCGTSREHSTWFAWRTKCHSFQCSSSLFLSVICCFCSESL